MDVFSRYHRIEQALSKEATRSMKLICIFHQNDLYAVFKWVNMHKPYIGLFTKWGKHTETKNIVGEKTQHTLIKIKIPLIYKLNNVNELRYMFLYNI